MNDINQHHSQSQRNDCVSSTVNINFSHMQLVISSTECKTLGVSQNTISYTYQSYHSRAHISLYACALAFNVSVHCKITRASRANHM